MSSASCFPSNLGVPPHAGSMVFQESCETKILLSSCNQTGQSCLTRDCTDSLKATKHSLSFHKTIEEHNRINLHGLEFMFGRNFGNHRSLWNLEKFKFYLKMFNLFFSNLNEIWRWFEFKLNLIQKKIIRYMHFRTHLNSRNIVEIETFSKVHAEGTKRTYSVSLYSAVF
jgi:hypothetical protein